MAISKKQHFNEKYDTAPPKNYERFFVPVIGSPLAKNLISRAQLKPGERILDVGCGTGIIARMALRHVGKTGQVTGIDINPGMLAVARKLSPQIEWREASAESMPLPDGAFEVVLCQLSLQFFEHKLKALEEIWRVLAADGRLTLNVPGPAGPLMTILAETLGEIIGTEAEGFVNHVFSMHNTAKIQKLLRDAGFSNIDTQTTSKVMVLPEPKDFLWQYIHSTPLAAIVLKADDQTLASFEQEIVNKWQKFVYNDGCMKYEQSIISASALK